MATSKGANTYNRLNWEESDFPVLCQTCLGDNPYLRMYVAFTDNISLLFSPSAPQDIKSTGSAKLLIPSKTHSCSSNLEANTVERKRKFSKQWETRERFGKECKICSRPFTVFRWCPGARMRFKKTEVCQTCSKQKNVCQTCLLDLEYGLPVQVRDYAMNFKDEVPKSEVNREYYSQNLERNILNTDSNQPYGALAKAQTSSDLLMKLARTSPYYKRNRPHICSFWVKGECKRGEECPYRHEKPTDPDDPLADQNIKDRYYGANDPVADKLLRRAATMPKLEPPEDRTITTLYVGNLGEQLVEKDLKDHFYQYGEIRSITLLSKQQCAFIQFTSRSSAEAAAEKAFNKLILGGKRLTIKWGRAQAKIPTTYTKDGEGKKLEPVPGLPGALPPPPEELANNYFNLPPTPQMMPPPLPFPPPHLSLLRGQPPIPMRFPMPPPPPPPPMAFLPRGLPPPPILHPPGSYSLPPIPLPPAVTSESEESATPKRPTIHYPSQDPQRMGSSGITKT